jgi:hypothetical protein
MAPNAFMPAGLRAYGFDEEFHQVARGLFDAAERFAVRSPQSGISSQLASQQFGVSTSPYVAMVSLTATRQPLWLGIMHRAAMRCSMLLLP